MAVPVRIHGGPPARRRLVLASGGGPPAGTVLPRPAPGRHPGLRRSAGTPLAGTPGLRPGNHALETRPARARASRPRTRPGLRGRLRAGCRLARLPGSPPIRWPAKPAPARAGLSRHRRGRGHRRPLGDARLRPHGAPPDRVGAGGTVRPGSPTHRDQGPRPGTPSASGTGARRERGAVSGPHEQRLRPGRRDGSRGELHLRESALRGVARPSRKDADRDPRLGSGAPRGPRAHAGLVPGGGHAGPADAPDRTGTSPGWRLAMGGDQQRRLPGGRRGADRRELTRCHQAHAARRDPPPYPRRARGPGQGENRRASTPRLRTWRRRSRNATASSRSCG